MRLAGASRTPRITASEPLPGNVYYAGAGAPASRTPIDTFARVEYAGVYPGIDLVYYGDDHHLEFDFLFYCSPIRNKSPCHSRAPTASR